MTVLNIIVGTICFVAVAAFLAALYVWVKKQ